MLHKQNIKKKLLISMFIIVLSLFLISIPLISNSYKIYMRTSQALIKLQVLQALADTINGISRERGYSNKLMSSDQAEWAQHQQALLNYQHGIDQHIQHTVLLLNQQGFAPLANQLNTQVRDQLYKARQKVNHYSQLPQQDRTMYAMDEAIVSMFQVWDQCNLIIREFVHQSKADNSRLFEYFTEVMILVDLRDQAGRVASDIIPPVTFSMRMPTENRERSLRSQQQVIYLWGLLNTLHAQQDLTPEYLDLHHKVEELYMHKGLNLIGQLIKQGQTSSHYSLTGTQLTERMVDKFTPVVELQRYIIQQNMNKALEHQRKTQWLFIFALTVSMFSFLAALFTLIYAKKRVFDPLLQVRDVIFALSEAKNSSSLRFNFPKQEFFSLFEALQKLQLMLQQRDEMEIELKKIAHSDSLTGVGNRLALSEYILAYEHDPDQFMRLCLMIIDIDDFKKVNDTYGHMIGDQVIRHVAQQLKQHTRHQDLVVRYGGDEFLLIVDRIDLPDAVRLGESIRHLIATTVMQIAQQQFKVSVTIGLALGAKNWIELMKKADDALLKAKMMGKNKILSLPDEKNDAES